MKILRFYESLSTQKCKASILSGNVVLYRLTSHPVVDLDKPGEYYVCDKLSINPEILDKNDVDPSNIYIISVKCDSSNIDIENSEIECNKLNDPNIIVVKDSSQCEVISVIPYSGN